MRSKNAFSNVQDSERKVEILFTYFWRSQHKLNSLMFLFQFSNGQKWFLPDIHEQYYIASTHMNYKDYGQWMPYLTVRGQWSKCTTQGVLSDVPTVVFLSPLIPSQSNSAHNFTTCYYTSNIFHYLVTGLRSGTFPW